MCGFVNNEAAFSDVSADDIQCLFGNVEAVYNFNRSDVQPSYTSVLVNQVL